MLNSTSRTLTLGALLGLGVALVTLTVSCGKTNTETKHSPHVTAISLKTVSYTELDTYVASQKGKVVLVDIWGITCAPCMKKFPHVVQLHEKFAEKGLAVVTVSTDLPESEEKILKFLNTHNATFTNFRMDESRPTKDQDAKYPMSLQPTVILFGRDGRQAAAYEGGVKDEELDAEIEKLLKE